MKKDLELIRQRFIEVAGHTTQSLGVGRVLGQIFAQVYFSRNPQSLDDLVRDLQISKGSASMSVRQLEQWGAVRRVWVKGDRKDYYEAVDEFGRIARKALLDMIGRELEVSDGILEEAERSMKVARNGDRTDEDSQFIEKRIARLRLFRDRAQQVWKSSIVALLLK